MADICGCPTTIRAVRFFMSHCPMVKRESIAEIAIVFLCATLSQVAAQVVAWDRWVAIHRPEIASLPQAAGGAEMPAAGFCPKGQYRMSAERPMVHVYELKQGGRLWLASREEVLPAGLLFCRRCASQRPAPKPAS